MSSTRTVAVGRAGRVVAEVRAHQLAVPGPRVLGVGRRVDAHVAAAAADVALERRLLGVVERVTRGREEHHGVVVGQDVVVEDRGESSVASTWKLLSVPELLDRGDARRDRVVAEARRLARRRARGTASPRWSGPNTVTDHRARHASPRRRTPSPWRRTCRPWCRCASGPRRSKRRRRHRSPSCRSGVVVLVGRRRRRTSPAAARSRRSASPSTSEITGASFSGSVRRAAGRAVDLEVLEADDAIGDLHAEREEAELRRWSACW